MNRVARLCSLLLLTTACASAPPKVVVAPEPKVAEDLPTWCSEGTKPCRPERSFVERLCRGSFPGTALYLFQKSSPWQRRWIKARGISAQAPGGKSGSGELQFAEEVLLMSLEESTSPNATPDATPDAKNSKSRAHKTAAKQADAALIVLRWDGTCVEVPASSTATFQPGAQKHAPVNYEALDLSVQRSLLRDADIEKALAARKSACDGGASTACDEADQALSGLIVVKVRRGTKLSMPDSRP